jgi:hypothetical protein
MADTVTSRNLETQSGAEPEVDETGRVYDGFIS